MVVKGLLGWYSFVILMATRRNQAMHDLITRSTVQIRDPAKASPGQYVTERTDLADPSMPPWRRRIVVTGVYLLLTYIAVGVAVFGSMSRGRSSARGRFGSSPKLFNTGRRLARIITG